MKRKRQNHCLTEHILINCYPSVDGCSAKTLVEESSTEIFPRIILNFPTFAVLSQNGRHGGLLVNLK